MLADLFQCLKGTLGTYPVTKAAFALILVVGLASIVISQNGSTSRTRRKLRHLRKLGVSTSNMTDQFDLKYAAPEDTETHGPVRIKSLYIHPVKSCGYVEVSRALLTKTGFLYDRCFALSSEVADSDTGSIVWRFISQRTKPNMCHIKTELWLPHEKSDPSDPLVQAGGCEVLSFKDPDAPTWTQRLETLLTTWDLSAAPEVLLIAPLEPKQAQLDAAGIKLRSFRIHGREAGGLDLGAIPSVAAALPKLKRYLRIPEKRGLTLMRCTPDTLTRCDRNLAPLKNIGTPSVHGYTDQQPVNLNSLSSVHAVSALLPPENRPLNALRFRANIWITGAPAFAEESWKRYRIRPRVSGAAGERAEVAPKLSVVCRTSRCTMPNVNLETATFDADMPVGDKKKGKPQPSATLIEHRTVEDGNPSALGYIGMHCVPEDQDLEEAREQRAGLYVEVGDEIEVLETGVHLYGSTGNDY
ncbi:molybdopterin cofactor [Colletotrichum truncatum]|uniref:Molybdopterin cofactor n=1 Tax=Colletotrichum truncatum TaxID=5467 RepID=A0ACC3Z1I9_COLTU|nr:molybdopterin cofactor [Colletotrichum truncatum]XP_036580808.1 molybdopterin cofactor [Colletotrichum truncatum]KAF6780619.1 molybdopterin cofactor [Colletotrichum truncatum]KAF6788880.1 molybdopterin cofactor [Colletotrichum truncatum]